MKIPKARKLKNGLYFIQLRLGGASINVTGSSEKECIKKARLVKAEHMAGVRSLASGDMTLRQAMDAYIDARRNVISPATVRSYAQIRDLYFQDIVDIPLRDINDWQGAVNAEASRISAKTLKNAWSFVRSVFKFRGMTIPSVTLPQVIRRELPWIEPDDIPAFIKAANKNSASRRTVPIMIPRLRSLLENLCGDPLPISNPNTTCDHINRACINIGIEPVGTHGLRRSFASLCYHLRLSERETMMLGGWSDANTMRQIYIKLSERDLLKAQNKLLNFFENSPAGSGNAGNIANGIANECHGILKLKAI